MSTLVKMLKKSQIKTCLAIFGIGFSVFLVSMVMIFGSFGGIGIALGIPIALVSLITAITGGVSTVCFFDKWMDL